MTRLSIVIISIALLSTFLFACSTGATEAQLKSRAAFDFDCNESQLVLHKIDDRTRGVTGCGHRATYVEVCNACANGYQGCDCSWLLNTDGRRDNDNDH